MRRHEPNTDKNALRTLDCRAGYRSAGTALIVLVVGLTTAFSAAAYAQDLYIVGGLVHTVSGPPAEATVVIRDGLISTVGVGDEPGPEAEVIDATGMVVTPGLVDFHTQLGLVEISADSSTRDADAGGEDEVRAGFRAVDALNPDSVLIPVTRLGGVTSVVAQPNGGLIAGQSAWFDLLPGTLEEIVAEDAVTMNFAGGSGAGGAVGNSRGSAMMRYRELFADVSAYTEDPSAYRAGRLRELSLSLLDIEALADVVGGDLPVLVSANRRADIEAAIRLGDAYGLSLVLAGSAEAWMVAEALADREIPVLVDALANAPSSFEQLGSRSDAAARLDQAGVPVILTTYDTHNTRVLRQIAGNAVRAGMQWDSALEAVTVRPARAAGLDDRYGTLDPGKIANIVVWTGDPFELSTRVRAVIVHGEQQPLVSRQTQLFDRYRALRDGETRARPDPTPEPNSEATAVGLSEDDSE